NCAQRSAQFVRKRREEFILESSGPLRGDTRASLGVQHFFALLIGKLNGLDPLGLRQVAGELGVAEEATAVAAKGRDGDMGPKRGAVLAQAPSGIDKSPLFRRRPQLVLRPATFFHIGGIEDREVLADNVVGRVALDPLSAAVPSSHPAIGVEHKDCVLADAFYQEAKALFASAQLLIMRAPLRQITRDLGEP